MNVEQYRAEFEREFGAAGFLMERREDGCYTNAIVRRFWWLLSRAVRETGSHCITGFYENERPEFRQGTPEHELEEILTAADVNAMIAIIDDRMANAVRYELLTKKIEAGELVLIELSDRKEIVHGPEKAKLDAVLDAINESVATWRDSE